MLLLPRKGAAQAAEENPSLIVVVYAHAGRCVRRGHAGGNGDWWAMVLGPATATPENMATPTSTPAPLVVTNTPTPANAATAAYEPPCHAGGLHHRHADALPGGHAGRNRHEHARRGANRRR